MAAAAKNLTPVVLELGGKCPALVDSDVNLQVKIYSLLLNHKIGNFRSRTLILVL